MQMLSKKMPFPQEPPNQKDPCMVRVVSEALVETSAVP